jgi:hypothetical protein
MAASSVSAHRFGDCSTCDGTWGVDAIGWRHIALIIWSLAMLPIAFSFYRMCQRNRIWYGAFELTIALGFFYFLLVGMIDAAKPMTNRA